MFNYTKFSLENTCPACDGGVSSSGALMAMVILFCLLGMMVVLVFALLVLTYYQATLVERSRNKYVPSRHDVDKEIVEEIKNDLDEAYCTIPEEYIDQKIELIQHKRKISQYSSGSSSSRARSDSQEAIDTMLGMLVNPSACQEQRRQSSNQTMDVQDAISVFNGKRRSSSVFQLGDEFNRKALDDEIMEIPIETNNTKRRAIRRSISYAYQIKNTIIEGSTYEKVGPQRSISFPDGLKFVEMD
jgi:hypothetical protein